MGVIARQYTPELADLMEHEKVIEQGLATFIDVGWALLAIRDGEKYRAAGFNTFEHYCLERWNFSGRHARRLMDAAETAKAIEGPESGPMGPASERQVRPLASLKDDPEGAREAWSEAVADAESEGRAQPTAKQVEKAVAKRREPPKREHPAPFSGQILSVIAPRVQGAQTVLDPFAGIGRVHELRNLAGVEHTIGIEIEPEWADKHPDTFEGNALALDFDDDSIDAIATSPTYGNRMADHHDAKDDSARLTYKHSLGRDLHEDNSGAMQWGTEYRDFHLQAWAEAARVLKPDGTFVVNIKDHIRDGRKQDVVAWHIDAMYSLGLRIVGLDIVPTRGLMAGENDSERVCAEFVLTFLKGQP